MCTYYNGGDPYNWLGYRCCPTHFLKNSINPGPDKSPYFTLRLYKPVSDWLEMLPLDFTVLNR